MSYLLIDELPNTTVRKPPWSPMGLFLLTWLFLPFAAPFWIINWGRLGEPRQRLLSGFLAMLAFVVPFALKLVIPNSPVSFMSTLLVFGYGYFQANLQRPFFLAHKARGGAHAPVWPLWVTAVLAVAVQIAIWAR